MTDKEKKVYECVKKNDTGSGYPAESYFAFFKAAVPDYSPGTTDESFVSALQTVNDHQTEINMTEDEFAAILDSLVEQGHLKMAIGSMGEILYSIAEKNGDETNGKASALPNFFIGEKALNCLLGMEVEETDEYVDFTVDIIEAPFWLSFRTDEKEQVLRVFRQMEMYTRDESVIGDQGSLVLDRASKQVKAKAIPDIGDNLLGFYKACRNLSSLIRKEGLESLYTGLDPEQAGILITERNGELSWKVVSGSERPDIMVQTIFGDVGMARPYLDDFWARSALDMMDPDELIQAAEDGDEEAMQRLAMAYLKGDDGFEQDPEKAVYWNRKLAEAGDPIGMFNMGLHTAKGYGTPRDFMKAAEWMEKAAEAGDTDAPAAAEEYRRLAGSLEKAEAGDAQAQADLAGGYMRLGNSLDEAGPGEDYAESLKWAERSAAQDNGDGLWILALAYEHGRGVAQDKKKAVELYRRGAELGHAKCQHSLGCYYGRGEIVPKDEKKAFDLFKKSAEQGYGLAMQGLGSCYQFGNGTDHDMDKAIEWYEKSLEVLYDPEIARKVSVFKQLGNAGDAGNAGGHEDYSAGPPIPYFRVPADDEDVPAYTFRLAYTKKGDRKERSNRIKVGDNVRLEYSADRERINAVTKLGDIGDVAARYCWLARVIDRNIPYEAHVSKLVSYDQLDSKKKNPVIEVTLDLNMKWAAARDAIGWKYLPPEDIYYYDAYLDDKDGGRTVAPPAADASANVPADPQDEEFDEALKTVAAAAGSVDEAAETEVDPDKFTYHQKLKGKGPGYEIDIPDGFVFKKDPGERAFVAYIPDDEDPDDEIPSPFVIYAGRRIENESLKDLKTVPEYVAVAKSSLRAAAKATNENVRIVEIERRDLPGAAGSMLSLGALHVNAFVGIGDHIQTVRFQITGVNDKNRARFEAAAMRIINSMTTDDPVELLKPLDDEVFRKMTPGDPVSAAWKNLIGDYVGHFALARNIEIGEIVERYKPKLALANLGVNLGFQGAGVGNAKELINELYKEIKQCIKRYSKYAEEELLKAEPIYMLMYSQDPDNEALNGLKEAVNSLAEFADQEVNIDKDHIEAKSKVAAEVLKRMPLSPAEIAEKKRQEEERIRKEKEKEEKKRQEEEKRKREEAERRAAEEKNRQINAEVIKTISRDRARCKAAMGMIACSGKHLVAVKPDGTVVATGSNEYKQCEVSGWRDIVAVDCDDYGTVGLTRDGRVRYTGWNTQKESACTKWTGIRQIAMSDQCVFGLKADGTVAATPGKTHPQSTAPDVTTWRDIKEIRRMAHCVIGIDSHGNAKSVVRNYYGRAEGQRTYSGIIDAAAGGYDTVIVQKKDGSCSSFPGKMYKPQEIKRIFLLDKRPVAILSDGKVILGAQKQKENIDNFLERHENDKMIAVSGDRRKFAFLTEDGRIFTDGASYGTGSGVKNGEPFGKGFRLFDDFNKLLDEREEAEKRAAEEKARREREEAERAREEEERRRKEEEARVPLIYQEAVEKMASDDLSVLREAKRLLEQISDKRDVQKEIVQCADKIRSAEAAAKARSRKKAKRVLICIGIVLVLLAAAFLFLQGKLKASLTEKLISNQWYELNDSGVPTDMLDFEDKENVTSYNTYDLLNNKWSDPYKYTWSYEKFGFTEAVLNLDDDLHIKVSRKKGGELELTGENFVGTYVSISDEEFNASMKKLAADTRERMYQEVLNAIRSGDYDEAGDKLSELGDYKESKAIMSELTEYGKVLSSMPKGTYVGRETFAAAIEFMETAKYIKFSPEMQNFLKTVGPFIGKWEYSSGDIRTISYKAKEASGFKDIEKIEVTCEVQPDKGVGTFCFAFNDGSTSMYVTTSEIDYDTRSFKETRYVGGNTTYTLSDDDTIHVEFTAKYGSPAPSQASADYTRAD